MNALHATPMADLSMHSNTDDLNWEEISHTAINARKRSEERS